MAPARSVNRVGFEQSEPNRHQDPAFDRNPSVARRDKTPSRSDRLQSGVVERIEPRRVRNLGALDRAVGADQHPDRHGPLLFAPPRDSWVDGRRITTVIRMRSRIGVVAGAAIGDAGRPRPTTSAAVGSDGGRTSTSRVAMRRG